MSGRLLERNGEVQKATHASSHAQHIHKQQPKHGSGEQYPTRELRFYLGCLRFDSGIALPCVANTLFGCSLNCFAGVLASQHSLAALSYCRLVAFKQLLSPFPRQPI